MIDWIRRKETPFAHSILSPDESAGLEERLLAGNEDKEWAAMQAAGRAVGAAISWDTWELSTPVARRILVLAGKGHNGGDALLACEELLQSWEDAEAIVILPCEISELRPLTRRAYDALLDTDFAVETYEVAEPEDLDELVNGYPQILVDVEVVIDGLLGFQCKPPLREPIKSILEAVNQMPWLNLRAAVDLPSGVGVETDAGAFRADFTYACGIAKQPLFEPANKEYVGRLRYLDIGFFDHPVSSEFEADELILNDRVLYPLQRLRNPYSDKRAYGHVALLGGSIPMPGAILMAAQAAVRSGAGLTTVFTADGVGNAFAAALPEAMWQALPVTPGGGIALEAKHAILAGLGRATVLCVGPGMGREKETQRLIAELVRETPLPVVLDADALFPGIIDAVKGRPKDAGGVVLTPHAGEYARIAGDEALRDFAADVGAVVVRKGYPTVISEGERVYYSPFGGPVLARGGSGDLLAGMVATQLGQPHGDSLEQACRAVVWHGTAADLMARRQGQTACRALDLLDHLTLGSHT